MSIWFECKVRYHKQIESGDIKKVTEAFLVQAESVTEADARIIEERTPYTKGDLEVKSVKTTPYSEVFYDETAEKWYIVKVAFIVIDEKTAKEKRSVSQIMVSGSDFKEAYDNFVEGMKTSMADYEIVSIAETPIIEVYKVKLGD